MLKPWLMLLCPICQAQMQFYRQQQYIDDNGNPIIKSYTVCLGCDVEIHTRIPYTHAIKIADAVSFPALDTFQPLPV